METDRLTRFQTYAGYARWPLLTLISLWLYWAGLEAWFQADDFAWLGLHLQVYDWRSFIHAMFWPMAQGTIRPLSERGLFLLFWRMFGLDAEPYRLWAFLTQLLNVFLFASILRKVALARLTALVGPLFWAVNAALAVPLSWTSAYNELLCASCLLGAFRLLLSFAGTSSWAYWWLQLFVFTLGFGALELNVVYPALALCWIACRGDDTAPRAVSQRTLYLSVFPLVVLSIIYYSVHLAVAPIKSTGIYGLHFGTALSSTLWAYWQSTLVPEAWTSFGHNRWVGTITLVVLSSVLAGFISYQSYRKRRLPLFFFSWYLITLSPFLPLGDHKSAYYLTVPSIGLAAVGAMAVTRLVLNPALSSVSIAALAIGLYLLVQVQSLRATIAWQSNKSQEVRNIVLGVQRAHELHPGKTIVLTDLSTDLYARTVAASPFQLLGFEVYLAPEELGRISDLPSNIEDVSKFILPAGPMLKAIADNAIVVYSAAGEHLMNVTGLYEQMARTTLVAEVPRRVDVGNPLLSYLLGPTWYGLERAYRWMPKTASVRLAGPRSLTEQLTLTGYCSQEQLRSGPLNFKIYADSILLSNETVSKPSEFSRTVSLPVQTVGRSSIEVSVETSRVFQESGPLGRPLGLAFGVFEIH